MQPTEKTTCARREHQSKRTVTIIYALSNYLWYVPTLTHLPELTDSSTVPEPESPYEIRPRNLDTLEDTYVVVRIATDISSVICVRANVTDSVRSLKDLVLDHCEALIDSQSGDEFYLSYHDTRLLNEDALLGDHNIGRPDLVQLIRYPRSILKEERRLQMEGSASRNATVDDLERVRSAPVCFNILADEESNCF